MKSKKAVFFSTDALIALSIILLVVVIAIPIINSTTQQTSIHRDTLTTLSALTMDEIDSSILPTELQYLTSSNKSVLDQIGELYLTNLSAAKSLASAALLEIDPVENIGIWYANTLIWSNNETPIEDATKIDTARQTISGIQSGTNVTGFSARAFLSSGVKRDFFYFGGFTGDGNITAPISYTGNLTSAELEIAINKNFEVYINDIFSGNYAKSVDEFTPQVYNLNSYLSNFNSGDNEVDIRGTDLGISGGFIKIIYQNDEPFQPQTRYKFPGIVGLINLYDGFYVPGIIESMEISLHLNTTSFPGFLNIGNITVWQGTTSDEETITISDSTLSSILDYNSLSETNVPLRLGLDNITFNGTLGDVDVFSVTDLSGSMAVDCSVGSGGFCEFSQGICESWCGGTWSLPIEDAKDANELFIDTILNYSNNRIGLVGYSSSAPDTAYHELSENANSLKTEVNSWTASGNTAICAGINRAATDLFANSTNQNVSKSIVVMSDGQATTTCSQQGTGDPSQDAIQAACDANANNITVHAVAFGTDADQNTLQQIASCGGGNFYFSDVDDLVNIYGEIANDIITQFVEQSIETTGEFFTELYPDSYIEFTYNESQQPFGLVLTTETDFTDANSATLEIPSDVSVIKATVTSYSGPKWTNVLELNGISIYDIKNYGSTFTNLGDPFSLDLPVSEIQSQNNISLNTAVNPTNYSDGSQSNKIITTIVKNASSLSAISLAANGCIWHVQFENGNEISTQVPSTYSGTSSCYYNVTHPTPQYDSNDAFQSAVFELLSELDLDSDNQVDVQFTEQDLQIALTEVTGIPFASSTEIQVRIWS